MLQIILTLIIYLILVIPAGIYVYHVAAGKHTFADLVLNRVDGVIYKICGIDPKKQHELENLCRCSGGHQRRHDSAWIYHSENPKHCPVQSEWDWKHGGIPFL